MENKQGFRVNQYINLKLEDKKTVIYINQKRFIQCKSLLLNIPIEGGELIENIGSIDEAAEKIGWTSNNQLITNREINFELTPQVAFWGHCSNLQAWVEHDYDTRLLHSNIAFPLLKRLAEEGDKFARIRLQEEITERFLKGIHSTKLYLIEENFLNYLDEEKLNLLINSLPKNFWSKFITYAENNIDTYQSDEKEIFYQGLASNFKILKLLIKNLKEMDLDNIFAVAKPIYLTDLINEGDPEIIYKIIECIKFFEKKLPHSYYWKLFFGAIKSPTPKFIIEVKKILKRNDIKEFKILLKLRWIETFDDIEFLNILEDSTIFFMDYLSIIIKDSLYSRYPRSNSYQMEYFMGLISKLQNLKEKVYWNRLKNSLGERTDRFFKCLIYINNEGADKRLTNNPEDIENYAMSIMLGLKEEGAVEFLRSCEEYKNKKKC